jgi:hypothetical protein
MKVKCISGEYSFTLETDINTALEKIEQEGNMVVDIKQSGSGTTSGNQTMVSIFYCDPKELRNIKLNKILQ